MLMNLMMMTKNKLVVLYYHEVPNLLDINNGVLNIGICQNQQISHLTVIFQTLSDLIKSDMFLFFHLFLSYQFQYLNLS